VIVAPPKKLSTITDRECSRATTKPPAPTSSSVVSRIEMAAAVIAIIGLGHPRESPCAARARTACFSLCTSFLLRAPAIPSVANILLVFPLCRWAQFPHRDVRCAAGGTVALDALLKILTGGRGCTSD